MNNLNNTNPRRSTLEKQAELLGFELRNASGPSQVWSEGGQPSRNRWAVIQGGRFYKGFGTLQDVAYFLEEREIVRVMNEML